MFVLAGLSMLFTAFPGKVVRLIPAPQATAAPSAGGSFAAITAPLRDKEGRPKTGMIVRLVHMTPDANVRALWSARLAYWPGTTVVSDDGRIATVGSWCGFGGHEAITLFDDAGRVLANHPIEEFATPEERASLSKITSNAVPTLLKEAHYESALDAFLYKVKPKTRSRAIEGALVQTYGARSVLAVRLTSGRTVYFDPGDGRMLKP